MKSLSRHPLVAPELIAMEKASFCALNNSDKLRRSTGTFRIVLTQSVNT